MSGTTTVTYDFDEALQGKGGIACIYSIMQKGTDRIYIGSTVDHFKRFQNHRSALRAGAHRNRLLQRAWVKHGIEAFAFAIVQVIPSEEELIFWEQFWIDRLKPFFNLCPEAEAGFRGRAMTLEHRAKIGAALRGRKRPADVVERAAEGTRRAQSRPDVIAARALVAASRACVYRFVSPDGNLVEVENLKRFCRERGLSQGNMHMVHAGKRRHHKGWMKEEVI